MPKRAPSSIHDEHYVADIMVTNFGGGTFKAARIIRSIYNDGVESSGSFVARVQKAQRKVKAELKLKSEFFKKMPEFKINWHKSEESV